VPELPEVETVVRGLRQQLVGERLTLVVAHRPDLRFPLPPDLGQRLTGATVVGISRRAKYGLIATDRGDTLIFHLGMSGRFRQSPAERGPHDHLRFETARGALVYTDPRRFGFMALAPSETVLSHPLLAALGPEPLGPAFTCGYLAGQAVGRMTPIKALLLNQHVVAGVGNIYACEALFQAGINPVRRAGRIAERRLGGLVDALRAVLLSAIEAGGSTLRDHAQVSGELGYFQHGFAVYGRAGKPCPACGAPVLRRPQGGRSTFCCQRCQR